MAAGSSLQVEKPKGSRFLGSPATRLGRWAAILGVVFVIMFLINTFVFMPMPETSWGPVVLPFYGIGMMLCGLLAGVFGVVALVKYGERSWVVWAICILPGLWVIFMLVGELLFPH